MLTHPALVAGTLFFLRPAFYVLIVRLPLASFAFLSCTSWTDSLETLVILGVTSVVTLNVYSTLSENHIRDQWRSNSCNTLT